MDELLRLRAAPLGEASPEVVTALFYGFHPRLVARALPTAWQAASAERFLAVRTETVGASLHRLLGPDVLASPESPKPRTSPGRPR